MKAHDRIQDRLQPELQAAPYADERACSAAFRQSRRSAEREGGRRSRRASLDIALCTMLGLLLAASASADTWPTFHGDFSLSGYSKAGIPEKPKLLWRYDAGAAVHAAPVADELHIFVATKKGNVHALDFAGKQQWSYTHSNASDSVGMDAPLIVYTFAPVVGRPRNGPPSPDIRQTVVAAYVDGTVRAFDGFDGKPRWSGKVDGPIKSTPVVSRRKDPIPTLIVMSQPSGDLSALELLTGKPRWQQAGPERADGHLALSDDLLVFGSCAAAIHTLPTAGGESVTGIALGEGAEVAGGVATYGGHAYTGNRSGSIVAANLNSQTNLWVNEEWTGEIFTTPAVDGKHLIAVNGYGSVLCLDLETGKKLWLNEGGAVDAKSPVIAGNSVVASIDGTLVVLDLEDGKERWRYDISDEITSPSIIRGMIMVGTDEGQVLAFGSEKGK